MRTPRTFTTEADLCAAFIAYAEPHGWTPYAETAGWDILLVSRTGTQIGIQAKLRFTTAVLVQAVEQCWHWKTPGPDFRAMLCPRWGRQRRSLPGARSDADIASSRLPRARSLFPGPSGRILWRLSVLALLLAGETLRTAGVRAGRRRRRIGTGAADALEGQGAADRGDPRHPRTSDTRRLPRLRRRSPPLDDLHRLAPSWRNGWAMGQRPRTEDRFSASGGLSANPRAGQKATR